MGLLDKAKSAFNEVAGQAETGVNKLVPGSGPFGRPRPKPVTPSQPEWWNDLDLYDFATKQIGIPTGIFRVKLKDGAPAGGMELAPDYKRGGKGYLAPDFNEKLRYQPNEDEIAAKFQQIAGRAPTDDEIVILLASAGHKPGRIIKGGGTQIIGLNDRPLRDVLPGEEVGLGSGLSRTKVKSVPLRHDLSFSESDITEAKVAAGYRHESDLGRLSKAADAFIAASPFVTTEDEKKKLREEDEGAWLTGSTSDTFKQIMAGLGLAGEASQFAAENVGGGITMGPAEGARAAGLNEFADTLEHPITRGGVGNAALLFSGLPIISIAKPTSIIGAARLAGLGGRVGAGGGRAAMRGSMARGNIGFINAADQPLTFSAGAKEVIATEIVKQTDRAENAVVRMALENYGKETGIKMHRYPISEEGIESLEKQANTMEMVAGKLKQPEKAEAMRLKGKQYRDASNLIRGVLEREIPMTPAQIEAANFVGRVETRRPTGLMSTVYHGTPEVNAEAIEASGLAKGSWVTGDRDTALLHAVNRELGGIRAYARKLKIPIKGKNNEQLFEEIKAAGGGEIPGVKVYEFTAPTEAFTGQAVEGVSTTKRALKVGETAQPALMGRVAMGKAKTLAKQLGISTEGKEPEVLLNEIKAASAHVPESLSERGLPAYSDIPIYQYVKLLERARALPKTIGEAEEIVKLARARSQARRLAKQEAALGENARKVGAFLDSLEGDVVPNIDEARDAARAAGISEKTVMAKNAEDLSELVVERWADLAQFASKPVEGVPFSEVVESLKATARTQADDILHSLRWTVPGETELGYIEKLPASTRHGRVVTEAAEAVASKEVPRSVDSVLDFLDAEPSHALGRQFPLRGGKETDAAYNARVKAFAREAADNPAPANDVARVRHIHKGGMFGRAIADLGIVPPEGLGPVEQINWLRSVREALRRGASEVSEVSAVEAAPHGGKIVVRLGGSGRLVELPPSAAASMKAVFSATNLSKEVKNADRLGEVSRVISKKGVESTVKISKEQRMADAVKAAKGISLSTLEEQVTRQARLRSRISKDTINKARAVAGQNSPERNELRAVVGKLQDIEHHNVEIAKRVAELTNFANDPVFAAASREKRMELIASREASDMKDFVKVIEGKMPFVAEGRTPTDRQVAIMEAIKRLTDPSEIVAVSDDARVGDIMAQAGTESRSEVMRLLANTEAHNLGRGGDVGMFAKSPLGPLVRLITGRFTNHPIVMGIFWADEMAKNTGGLTNSRFIAKLSQIAEEVVPIEARGALPKNPAERLSAFLASKFDGSNAKHRAILGISNSKYGDEALELLKGDLATYLNYPELYKGVPDSLADLSTAFKTFNANFDDTATALGIQADALREAARESIVTDKVGNWLRQIPDDTSLKKGIGSTWEHLARAIDTDPRLMNRGYSLKGLTKHGRDLILDYNNARFRHIVQRRTAEAIANMSTGARATVFYSGLPEDAVRANKDLSFKKAKSAISYINGQWNIGSHELWAPEVRPWLNGLASVLSGGRAMGGPLGFVQDLFRTLMMGRLVLDASILGIQGSFYTSARTFMKPGKGLVGMDAVPQLATEALKMTNTDYFTNWMWQNGPELRAYFGAGLSTGVEGLVGSSAAGARRMLLVEQIPTLLGRIEGPIGRSGRFLTTPLGKGGAFVRGINDIMFDRWLLYMKVNVIRQHLDTVQMMRTAFRQPNQRKMAEELLDTEGTGMNLLGRELGNKDLMWLGTTDEVLQGVVRVVNNQLGGITRAQMGRSMWRETFEQLTLMVPGFWRARLGLLVSGVTRPHTVEGSLAVGQMFREYAFFGAWATMISMMTGNMDKLNLHDPRRPDWLAAQFGDFYIPMAPSSASSYRLMARLVAGINEDPTAIAKDPNKLLRPDKIVTGAATQRMDALRILLEGRMHPALQGVYEHINREDFLGNRLDTKQAQFLNYAQMLQPIFTEQMGDIVAAETNGTEADAQAIATQGLAAVMGKNIIPRNPIEKLDEYAATVEDADGQLGRRWFELGQHERSVARVANPDVEQWEMEWEESQAGKRDPTEKRTDAIFDRFPVIRADTKDAQIKLGQQLDVGAIDDEDFRNNFRLAQVGASQRMDELEELMRINGRDPEEAFAKRRENKDKVGLIDQAVIDYNAVDFDKFVHQTEVQTEFGKAIVDKIDFDGWDAAREDALNQYPEGVRAEALAFIRRDEPKIKTRYREAQEDLDTYFTIPKYKGFTPKESAYIDSVQEYFKIAGDKIRMAAKERGIDPPSGSRIRLMVLKNMVEKGQVGTKREAQMAAIAAMVARTPELKKKILNPARPAFVLSHPDLPLFFRFVTNDVPDELKDRLNPVAVGPESFEGLLAGREEFVD